MWEVSVRREARPLIDALKGKRVGYAAAYEELKREPCAEYPRGDGTTRPFAYRLTGALEPKVCGAHLKRGYRIAFTMRPADEPGFEGTVEVLYVGDRNTRDRSNDIWTIVHDLFKETNPLDDHRRPPCCQGGHPSIDEDELQEFMSRLRRLLRSRQGA